MIKIILESHAAAIIWAIIEAANNMYRITGYINQFLIGWTEYVREIPIGHN